MQNVMVVLFILFYSSEGRVKTFTILLSINISIAQPADEPLSGPADLNKEMKSHLFLPAPIVWLPG